MRKFRIKRMQHFMEVMQPKADETILDVGGNMFNWALVDCQSRIVLLNLLPLPPGQELNERTELIIGDALDMPFKDGQYGLGFSNSVIEHVATWENQIKFAEEIRRTCKRIWVQTPARECFMEPHLATPFIHWFPKGFRRKTLRWLTVWGWVARPSQKQVDEFVEEVRLITRKEMQQLFPDCKIVVERVVGLPKSYIAIRN